MSAAEGTFSASKEIGFNKNGTKNEELRDNNNKNKKSVDETEKKDHHEVHDDDDHNESEHDEEDDDKLKSEKELNLDPQFSLKEQLEKDKDDQSLRR